MERLEVLKTYKIYIGGQFPRTESGRYYQPLNSKGEVLGNICLCSKKDAKNAVVAARKAFGVWSGKSAFNRSQILYRIAEMLEGRKLQFVAELESQGLSNVEAIKELELSIDRLIYYAGWCDKYQQVMSSVNPVASSHFNFSVYEPQGVVGVLVDGASGLLSLVSAIAPIIAGGNTVVVHASEGKPLCAVTFAEVLNSSDVPGGVVNILTGNPDEVLPTLASHMDVNALWLDGDGDFKEYEIAAAENLKRIQKYKVDWCSAEGQSLYFITDFQEVKTTWHPIEKIASAGSGY